MYQIFELWGFVEANMMIPNCVQTYQRREPHYNFYKRLWIEYKKNEEKRKSVRESYLLLSMPS